MNSSDIFSYCDEFLDEIIEDIINLKIKKNSNPTNTEFETNLKKIVGKSFSEMEFNELISANNIKLKEFIKTKFSEVREERIKILGNENAKEIEKRIFLQSIDLNWKSHIQYLEQLRQVIGLRSYGQRDPLIEYKKEAFNLFSNLLEKLKKDYLTILLNLQVVDQSDSSNVNETRIQPQNNPKCILRVKQNKKISRNERCEATGKKFKNCCGAL